MDKKIEKFIELVKQSNNIVFFGGAGVSTESGIPDFRSKDGLYNQKDINFEQYSPEYLLSKECLYNNPKVFYEFYKQKMDTRNIKPNVTHKVLAQLEKMGKLRAIVTQNIDGLHQKAGSNCVYEIHGTTYRNHCISCGQEYDVNYIFDSRDSIPYCSVCCTDKKNAFKYMVRPNVTLYGENLPSDQVNGALNAIYNADMLIVAGTSLQVYPAADYISYFQGNHLVVINKEELNLCLNPDTDIVIKDSLGKVFSELKKRL